MWRRPRGSVNLSLYFTLAVDQGVLKYLRLAVRRSPVISHSSTFSTPGSPSIDPHSAYDLKLDVSMFKRKRDSVGEYAHGAESGTAHGAKGNSYNFIVVRQIDGLKPFLELETHADE